MSDPAQAHHPVNYVRIWQILLALPKVAEHTAGKTIRKVILVPGRLVNIVAN